MYIQKESKWLDKECIEYKGMDEFNLKCLLPYISETKMVKGMVKGYEHIVASVLRIKPLHIIGYRLKDQNQISKQWLRDKNQNHPTVRYVQDNNHIITGILKRKVRLLNEHLILSLLSGHYQKWVFMQIEQKTWNNRACCDVCKKCKVKRI